MAENPSEFDPRKFLGKTIEAMRDICIARYEAFNTAGNAHKIRVKNLESMHLLYDAGKLTPKVN
jgi:fructose-bisphosphate aldolase class II